MKYIISIILLFFSYVPSFIKSDSLLSQLLLPFLLLFFSGYSISHLFFKNESFPDKLIIGFGVSVLLNVIVFHLIMSIRKDGMDQMFTRLFIFVIMFVTIIPLFYSYFRKKNVNQLNNNVDIPNKRLLELFPTFVVVIVMLILLIVQIIFINIPNRSLDEYAYIYIARNLLIDHTNFTATPPWINKARIVPRYVFITLIAIFCSLFGFELESAELIIIASNIMLIPVIFSVATNLYDRKVGSVAAALIVVNPVFMLLSIRIYPDIPVVTFSWAGFYFLLKALNKTKQGFIEQKYVLLYLLFLILALFTKYTVILLIPAFFLASFLYTRDQIVHRPNNSSSFIYVVFIICLIFALALVRFWSDIVDYLMAFSTKVESWDFGAIFDTMINPLGPISHYSLLILFGIFFSLKSGANKRSLIILTIAWAGFLPFFLLFPYFLPDQRHVFSQQISTTILAAFGIVSISNHRKLWKASLFLLLLAHYIDESLTWKGTHLSTFLIEVVFVVIILIYLREGIKRTVGKNKVTKYYLQSIILLGLIVFAFINAAFLDKYNLTREEQIRDESRIQAIYFLESVGRWIQANEIRNESIMTNAYATLPYYAGFIMVYVPPVTEIEFLDWLSQHNMIYLVIFWGTPQFMRHVLGGIAIPYEAPYLEKYVWNTPTNMKLVYSDKSPTIDEKEVGIAIIKYEI